MPSPDFDFHDATDHGEDRYRQEYFYGIKDSKHL